MARRTETTSTFRRKAAALLTTAGMVVALAAVTAGVAATPARAGTVADYPESPYAATDYNEALRGQFHFSSQGGWMNDINGPVYYRGTYHLFYQHNPHAPTFINPVHWGHATSTDLVHWVQKPIALEPGVHNGELWSGSAWVDVNNVTGLKNGADDPILLFYSYQSSGMSIAYSTDGAQTFTMYNGGSKVVDTAYESRDPKVQWDAANNRWVMVLWGNNNGNVGNFYSSTNLLSWTYRGQYRNNWFFECPDLYRLPVDGNTGNQKWVLQDAGGEYVIGQMDASGVFVSDWAAPQKMEEAFTDFNGTWYASQTFNQLPGGRVVQMGWQAGNHGSTWTGNASFPVDLALKTFGDGIRLTRNPVSEISGLRSGATTWGAQPIGASSDLLAGVNAETYEIQAEFDVNGATASDFGFQLHRRGDGSSDKTVAYNRSAQTLYGKGMTPIGNRVKMRLLVDRGQLEVFGNDGRLVVSDNVDFNPAASSLGVKLFAAGGSVNLVSMTFWRLAKAWSPAPGRSPAPNGIVWSNSAKCVDRDVASGRVQIWDCLGNANQTWALNADGTISSAGSCMQLPTGQTANRTLVDAATCASAPNQRWSRGANGSLVNQASGRCLDLDAGNSLNGRQLQVYDCVGGPNQTWSGPPGGGTGGSGPGRIAWSTTNKCVDRDVASGRVQIWDCLGNANQTWTLTADGSLTTGGVCMETPGGQTANRTLVGVFTCNSGTNQKWSKGANGALVNQASGRCLDLDAGNSTNGRQLQIYDCVGGPNQTWNGPV